MGELKKVLAIVLGDTNGRAGLAALELLKTYQYLEVLLVDDNLNSIASAQPVFSQHGRCSYIHTDISTAEGKAAVLEEMQKTGHWVQYLLNSYNDCPEPTALEGASDEHVSHKSMALNQAVYEITQTALAGMIKHANGRVDNISATAYTAYLFKRYNEGAQFNHHTHPNGEIIMVIDGDYADEKSVSFAGEYIRNPPNSEHTPYSKMGCVIALLVHDIAEHDQANLRVSVNDDKWTSPCEGVKVMPIHQMGKEYAAFIRYTENSNFKPWHYFNGGHLMELPLTLMANCSDLVDGEKLILVQTNNYGYEQLCFSDYLADAYAKSCLYNEE